MKVWMRDWGASRSASPARSISLSSARARPQTTLSLMVRATACTPSKSPGLAAGKPASMTSTRKRSSALAMRTFSSRVMEAPGLCSPSRKVVSKMMSLSVMGESSCCVRVCWPGKLLLCGVLMPSGQQNSRHGLTRLKQRMAQGTQWRLSGKRGEKSMHRCDFNSHGFTIKAATVSDKPAQTQPLAPRSDRMRRRSTRVKTRPDIA